MKTGLPLFPLALLLTAFPAWGQEKWKDSPYYPLAVGTRYTYRSGDRTVINEVVKHEKIGDVLCALVESRLEGPTLGAEVKGKVVASEHVAVADDGLYRHAFGGQKIEPPLCFLKLPPKAGESWTVKVAIGGMTAEGKYETAEEEVEVPAGTFKTLVARTRDFKAAEVTLSTDLHFVRDVGLVKQTLVVNGQEVVLELVKVEKPK